MREHLVHRPTANPSLASYLLFWCPFFQNTAADVPPLPDIAIHESHLPTDVHQRGIILGIGLNRVDGFRDEFLTQARQPQIHAKRVDLHEITPSTPGAPATPPGFIHLPRGAEAEWIKQLVAEQLVTVTTRRGFQELEWQKLRERNEVLDCRFYARAAARIAGADRWSGAKWRGLEDQLGPAPGQTDGNSPGDEPAPVTAGLLARASPATGTRRSTWLAVDKGWL